MSYSQPSLALPLAKNRLPRFVDKNKSSIKILKASGKHHLRILSLPFLILQLCSQNKDRIILLKGPSNVLRRFTEVPTTIFKLARLLAISLELACSKVRKT